jgi:hypothetical protein
VIRRHIRTVAVPVAVLVVLLAVYMSLDVQIHWFLHLFLGGSAALLVATAVGICTGRFGSALPIVTIGAVVNAIPDVLYLYFHVAHQPWMDVFTWHVEAHFMPGFPVSWYLIFMLALAVYFVTQIVPRTKPALRAAPLGVLVITIAGATLDAHRHIPVGVMTHHAGYLLGWAGPVAATAVLVALLRGKPSPANAPARVASRTGRPRSHTP